MQAYQAAGAKALKGGAERRLYTLERLCGQAATLHKKSNVGQLPIRSFPPMNFNQYGYDLLKNPGSTS